MQNQLNRRPHEWYSATPHRPRSSPTSTWNRTDCLSLFLCCTRPLNSSRQVPYKHQMVC